MVPRKHAKSKGSFRAGIFPRSGEASKLLSAGGKAGAAAGMQEPQPGRQVLCMLASEMILLIGCHHDLSYVVY